MNSSIVLAIAPSNVGFGFAVLEDGALIDYGVKYVEGSKNVASLTKMKKLTRQFRPDVLVLEDAKDSKRSTRIKSLYLQILKLAAKEKVKVKQFSRQQIMTKFLPEGGSRHDLAEAISLQFPELLVELPKRRCFYDAEDPKIDMFLAIAGAIKCGS